MTPEQAGRLEQGSSPIENWRQEAMCSIPGMGTHGIQQQHLSLSPDVEVRFDKGSKGVTGLVILAHGSQTVFQAMSTKQASAVIDRLCGIIDKAPSNIIADDPLPEVRHIRAALDYADEQEVSYLSSVGTSAAEISAAIAEAKLLELGEEPIRKSITVTEAEPHIYHVHMPTELLLSATFLRFTEHYESPSYRNKIFSLGEYKDWYRKTKGGGQFDYYESWGGFNVPDYAFDAFLSGRFNPLAPQEKALLEVVSQLERPFYIIGTPGRFDAETLRHEIAHGLYHVQEEYRKEAKAIIDTIDTEPVRKHLLEIGYCRAVIIDEIHAYLGDPLDYLEEQGIKATPYQAAHSALRKLYKQFTSV
jgi:hypothetical protein